MTKILFLIAISIIAGCSTKKIPITSNEAALKDVLSFNTTFIKKKSKLFTGDYNFRNLSAKNSILIYLHDITCSWGNQAGIVRNDRPFNIGEKTIDIKIGAVKMVKLRCDVNNEGSGEMTFTIKKIYDNPGHDGKIAGATLGENLVWKFKE